MDIRKNVYGLHKEALGLQDFTGAVGDAIQLASHALSEGGVYVLAAAGAAGLGIGYAASQMTAHGPQDIETAKKEYVNERLKADLGYLSGKTKLEYRDFINKKKPKPARVIA